MKNSEKAIFSFPTFSQNFRFSTLSGFLKNSKSSYLKFFLIFQNTKKFLKKFFPYFLKISRFPHFQPKRDIGLHLSESMNASLAAADAEIEKLERELAEADDELNKKKAVFEELVSIVESQQNKLWQ